MRRLFCFGYAAESVEGTSIAQTALMIPESRCRRELRTNAIEVRTTTMPIKLLLDPWSPDYEAPIQMDGPTEATGSGEVDPTVETTDWGSIAPSSTVVSRRICFVDGVRRLEARVMAHGDGGNLIHGLFASCGAGCVVNDERRATYQSIRIKRYLLLGAGKQKTARVVAGSQEIEFEGVASPGDSHDELVNSLQNLMRTSEVAVAEGFFVSAPV
jgi:hypothetical protein